MRARSRKPVKRADIENLASGGNCATCGKKRYLSRRAARHYARRYNLAGLSAYRCGDFWHLGHLPAMVKHGDLGRESLTISRARRPA